MMPKLIVIWIAKLVALLSRLLGRGEGNALPGLVAERLRPKLLAELGAQLGEGSILVTGTNGKTTTTRMIATSLASPGRRVLVNRAGSNLTRGLLSYLIAHTNWRGQIQADLAVLEVDEAAFSAAAQALRPKVVVVLNLFRDQLDRYGELATLATKVKVATEGLKAHLILNADDPLVAWLGQGHPTVTYFGLRLASVAKLPHDFAADSNSCPVCGDTLTYKSNYYSHIGDYECPNQDLKRPLATVVGNTTKVTLNSSKTKIEVGDWRGDLNLELPGLFNVYNALAALATATALEVQPTIAAKAISSMPPAFGRAEQVEIEGRKLAIYLVKNPTGYNQIIQAYLASPSQPVLMVLNDLIADGRDVSWIWDVAFEDFKQPTAPVVAGTRAWDLALRLKYADMESRPETTLDGAIQSFVQSIPRGQSGVILPTYTAMLRLRRELSHQIAIKGTEE